MRTPSLDAAREGTTASRPAAQGPLGAAAARLEQALQDAARLVRTIDAMSARLGPPEAVAAPGAARAGAAGRMLLGLETLAGEIGELAEALCAAAGPPGDRPLR
ncbi:MAG: hypothetical protein HY812_15905 [Planctomycetes bacterium]|nr:hypothetical protein [Planctomycetota bacterium]